MKKAYYLLISFVVLVLIVLSSDIGLRINAMPLTVRALAGLMFILPLSLLLFLVSVDKGINRKWRILAVIGIIYILICFTAAIISEAT